VWHVSAEIGKSLLKAWTAAEEARDARVCFRARWFTTRRLVACDDGIGKANFGGLAAISRIVVDDGDDAFQQRLGGAWCIDTRRDDSACPEPTLSRIMDVDPSANGEPVRCVWQVGAINHRESCWLVFGCRRRLWLSYGVGDVSEERAFESCV
jgi:hypothetical protein